MAEADTQRQCLLDEASDDRWVIFEILTYSVLLLKCALISLMFSFVHSRRTIFFFVAFLLS